MGPTTLAPGPDTLAPVHSDSHCRELHQIFELFTQISTAGREWSENCELDFFQIVSILYPLIVVNTI